MMYLLCRNRARLQNWRSALITGCYGWKLTSGHLYPQMSMASALQVATPRPPVSHLSTVESVPQAAAAPTISVAATIPSAPRTRGRSPRPSRSASSSSASSSSSDGSTSARSSSSSADASDNEHRRHRRRHRHSRRRSTRSRTSTRKSRCGKYCTSKYLKEGDKVDSFERLMLANIKMALALYRKKMDVKGFLKHLVLVAEKIDSGHFAPEPLIAYDDSVQESARKAGIRAFGKIDPSQSLNICLTSARWPPRMLGKWVSRRAQPQKWVPHLSQAFASAITSTLRAVLGAAHVSIAMFVRLVGEMATLMKPAQTSRSLKLRNEASWVAVSG